MLLKNPKPQPTMIRSEGLKTRERIDEILMICDRDNPVYEQISSYGIALYTIGYLECTDLMAVEDIDACEADRILRNCSTMSSFSLFSAPDS
jgi:hypothetical protein